MNLVIFGSETDSSQITITQSGGNTLEIDNVPSTCMLKNISVIYHDGFNTTSYFNIFYKEPFGNTNVLTMNIPFFVEYNHAVPSVQQPTTLQNYTLEPDGRVRIEKVGLTDGEGTRFRVVVV